MAKKTPRVMYKYLYTDDEANGTMLDTPEWFEWLDFVASPFSYCEVSFRPELRRNGFSWYAYKRVDGKLRKKYAGRTLGLNRARLDKIVSIII